MLMIQMMRCEDSWQERNKLKGTGWHYMVANRLESEWQVGPPGGPVGPGNGIWHA